MTTDKYDDGATPDDNGYPSKWFGRCGAAAADLQTGDAAMRQELAGCSRDELEILADLRFMFKDDCPPETRARSTTRLGVAQQLLDEMASAEGTYRLEPPPPASRPRRWWQAP